VRRARRRAVWVVWPPYNVGRRANAFRMWRYRPLPIFVSRFQLDAYPWWLPRPARPVVLPLGLPDGVRGLPPLAAPPPPRAIFASNPVRNLTWLIDLWVRQILPSVPDAELHIYGIRDYSYRFGEPWTETFDRLGRFLPDGFQSDGATPHGWRSLRPHAPVTQRDLWTAMRGARVMLYGGHRAEAFCLSVAEAQALGLPAVVRPIAVMAERVQHDVTGFVTEDAERFAQYAVSLLTDAALWRRQHEAALARQQGWNWDEVASTFEQRVIVPLLAPNGFE
jgi:glycosyltransferase involved in cell wall biosynthesis